MIKYQTDSGDRWSVKAEIIPVEVEKETETSVWIRGQRNNKVTQYTVYHDTWEAAKAYLIGVTTKRLGDARGALTTAEANYAKVSQINPPL